jgi:DNA-binding transcriptional ArsR family regulator
MVQYAGALLDATFSALSDPTRRDVLEQLGHGEASITVLADRSRMTVTGMRKHVGVLERAGLVVTEKVGRVRTCRLGARRLEDVAEWLERYHELWDERFSQLDQVIETLKPKEQSGGRTTTR